MIEPCQVPTCSQPGNYTAHLIALDGELQYQLCFPHLEAFEQWVREETWRQQGTLTEEFTGTLPNEEVE